MTIKDDCDKIRHFYGTHESEEEDITTLERFIDWAFDLERAIALMAVKIQRQKDKDVISNSKMPEVGNR